MATRPGGVPGEKIGKGARAGKGMVWDDEPEFAKAWLAYTANKDDPKAGVPFTPAVAKRWLRRG